MALKRLDEEFDLKPGTQLLPYMKRLLPSLEGRFQVLETQQDVVQQLTEEIRAAALLRMNEILIPATKDIIAVTKLGFLLGPSSTLNTLKIGPTYFIVDEGPQRTAFTPSPYLIVEREANITDYAIARLDGYNNANGELLCTITAWHGNPGPWSDWVISSTPGMADSTKIYHDEVGPWRDEVAADHTEVVQMHAEILAAAEALAESGLDVQAFIRRDGTVPFIATQAGITPPQGSNDVTIPTTFWTRARILEYTATSVQRSGDNMLGPLGLSGPPIRPEHATTKAYVDAVLGAGGIINANLKLQTINPTFSLQTTGTVQSRIIDGLGPQGQRKWAMVLGNAAAESGNSAGADFQLIRYNNTGVAMDVPLTISRDTGLLSTLSINFTGSLTGAGGVTFAGDLHVYRPNTNTGVMFMNAAGTAYHYYDGATHQFTQGGLNCGASPIGGGHLTCYSIYTQGYGITSWGHTNYGDTNNTGTLTTQGLTISAPGANYLQFYDQDWGPMYIHHNNDLIGFLSNGGGWVMYTTNAGHMWTPQYGWIHDYVNNTANNYAWNAANYRYNQLVSAVRWAYCGDLPTSWNGGNLGEPYGGSAVTGFAGYNGYNIYLVYLRFRQLQYCIAGGWYASWYA